MFDKNDITKDTPIPVIVDGHPLVTMGRVVSYGNNAIVYATTPAGVVEGSFSWDAVTQALNERNVRLPIPNYIPRPVTPVTRK